MQRLSRPVESMKRHYTVIVIGSGYGGGISASRLARAGQSVCLLERGKERLPGEFPDTSPEAAEEFQVDSPLGHVGSRNGMFDLRVNKEMNVLVGCGLGGTSLINANVSIRAEPRVFDDPVWPEALRNDLTTRIEAGYQRALEMLKPVPYSDDHPTINKRDAHRTAAQKMTQTWYPVPINVTFADPNAEDGAGAAVVNHVGVTQHACTGCGDCVSGCNVGAKNTTQMNYLPDAANHGAEIFTQIDVRHISRADGKWQVHFQEIEHGHESFAARTESITADIVVLSGGVLGSTEILLRSREQGLALSGQLGKHFSGNGDVLGFGYDCDQEINGIGWGHRHDGKLKGVGPTITSMIDHRLQPDLEQGIVIEEGSVPGLAGPIALEALGVLAPAKDASAKPSLWARAKELFTGARNTFTGPYAGPIHRTQTYLIMSHDGSDGVLALKDDRLRIDWPNVGEKRIILEDNKFIGEVVAGLGGSLVENPIWTEALGHSLITVHPLGGCAIGTDATTGVVNHKGQVYSGDSGEAVYEGLYVADGSVIPRSLGVNPLLTISAISERNVALMAEERGWKIDYTLPSAPREIRAQTVGVHFSDSSSGYLSTSVTDDYQRGWEQGKEAGSSFELNLTIANEDVAAMLASAQHDSRVIGTALAPALSSQPLSISHGVFNLMVVDPARVEQRTMRYRMRLQTEEGRIYYLDGYKDLHPASLLHLWSAATTLYVTLYDGEGPDSPVLGKGILRTSVSDFARQLSTMKAVNAGSPAEGRHALSSFGRFFAGELWDLYGGVFAPRSDVGDDAPARKKRPLRAPPPELHYFQTNDATRLRMVRFNGGTRQATKGPVILAGGFGMSSLAFYTDVLATNLVEYLTAHGYDVWCFDYRASPALESSKTQFTLDDIATRDWPAAVTYVRAETKAAGVQVIGHCMGSLTCFMALCAGLEGVKSFVSSQVTLNPVASVGTEVRADIHLGALAKALGVDTVTTALRDGLSDELVDTVLRAYPVAATDECQSKVCHRLSAIYGRVFDHRQLDELTHESLGELFGIATATALDQLLNIIKVGHAVDAAGGEVYMPHIDRLKLPITFIAGATNTLFYPKGSEITHHLLSDANGAELYDLHVIPDYAHVDCFIGKDAVHGVWPTLLAALDKHA